MNDMHQQLHDLYFNTSLNFLNALNNASFSESDRWLKTLDDLEKIMIEFGYKPKQINHIKDCAWESFQKDDIDEEEPTTDFEGQDDNWWDEERANQDWLEFCEETGRDVYK